MFMEEAKYIYNEYFNEEDRKRLSRMLMMSRAESGLSQEKVALELGIAKKTVQNWERGVSAPTLPQAIEWFRVMRVPAMPYFIQFMFPDMEGIKAADDDEKLRKELMTFIETMPAEGVRQLMFLFYGNHGSSPRAVLNLMTAHLQSPMRDRYRHATLISDDYKIAEDKSELIKPEHIKPNMDIIDVAITQGRKAVIKDRETYMLTHTEMSDS